MAQQNDSNQIIMGKDVTGFINVTPQQAYQSILHIHVKIIDLRSAVAFNSSHLKHAVNWCFVCGTFDKEISKQNHRKTYLLYGETQGESDAAMDEMEMLGFENVLNLSAGFSAWVEAKLPIEKK